MEWARSASANNYSYNPIGGLLHSKNVDAQINSFHNGNKLLPLVWKVDVDHGSPLDVIWCFDFVAPLVLGTNTEETNEMMQLDYLYQCHSQNSSLIWLPKTNLTNLVLNKTTEMLKFFGFIMLMTKLKYTSRGSLWSTVAPTKYWQDITLVSLECHSSGLMTYFVYWGEVTNPLLALWDTQLSEHYWWRLVNAFVATFSNHRAIYSSPAFQLHLCWWGVHEPLVGHGSIGSIIITSINIYQSVTGISENV